MTNSDGGSSSVESPDVKEPEVLAQGRGMLLRPIASIDDLVETFRLYQEVKDRLLEGSDYTWFAVWKPGKKEERKAFKTKAEAEQWLRPHKKRKVICYVEKKIKKSGCLKLGTAFAISTQILKEELSPPTFARFVVRATAPNGQIQDRSGACSSRDKGRSDSPFDHIEATALTRAINRAIMGVLGGETTAEEFDEASQVEEGAGIVSLTKPMTSKEKLDAIDDFASQVPVAKSVDQQQLIGRVYGAMAKTGFDKETATAKLKTTIRHKFKVESIKDLTEEQLIQLEQMILRSIENRKTAAKTAEKGSSK